MFEQYIVPAGLSLGVAIFTTWYTRYYAKNDTWREGVDKRLAEHSTKLALSEVVIARMAEDIHELKQDVKTLLFHILGGKDGRRSDA